MKRSLQCICGNCPPCQARLSSARQLRNRKARERAFQKQQQAAGQPVYPLDKRYVADLLRGLGR